MRLGLHASAHAKLKTHIGYITHLEHGIVCFPICSWLIISTLQVIMIATLCVTDEAVATKTDMCDCRSVTCCLS